VTSAATLHPDLLERLLALSVGPRRLLGIAGPPGAGKSTLAALMITALGGRAQAVPMDGFHLAQAELLRLGRAARKGAPDTFDVRGYSALLHRLRHQIGDEVVYAPDFRRDLEEAVAGAIAVDARTPLVITEGNYLLLQEDDWPRVTAMLDEVWSLQVDDTVRLERLTARHQQFGRTAEEAKAWIAQTDEPNARQIGAQAHRADRQVHWSPASSQFVWGSVTDPVPPQ
jgi:pantothenate kinase